MSGLSGAGNLIHGVISGIATTSSNLPKVETPSTLDSSVAGLALPKLLNDTAFKGVANDLGLTDKEIKNLKPEARASLQQGFRIEQIMNELRSMMMSMAQNVGAHGHLAVQLGGQEEKINAINTGLSQLPVAFQKHHAETERKVVAAVQELRVEQEQKGADAPPSNGSQNDDNDAAKVVVNVDDLTLDLDQISQEVDQITAEIEEENALAEEKAENYPHLDKEGILKQQRLAGVTTRREKVKDDIETQRKSLSDFKEDIRLLKHALQSYLQFSTTARELMSALSLVDLKKLRSATVDTLNTVATFSTDEIEILKKTDGKFISLVQAMSEKGCILFRALTQDNKLALLQMKGDEAAIAQNIDSIMKPCIESLPAGTITDLERYPVSDEILLKILDLGAEGLRALDKIPGDTRVKVNNLSSEERIFFMDIEEKTAKLIAAQLPTCLEVHGFTVSRTYNYHTAPQQGVDLIAQIKGACDACYPVNSDSAIKRHFEAKQVEFKSRLVEHHRACQVLDKRREQVLATLRTRVGLDSGAVFVDAQYRQLALAFRASVDVVKEIILEVPEVTARCNSFIEGLAKERALLDAAKKEVLRQYSWLCYALDQEQVSVPNAHLTFNPWYYAPLGYGNKYISFLGYAPAERVDANLSEGEEGRSPLASVGSGSVNQRLGEDDDE